MPVDAQPQVAIVIPCYNQGNYLPEAVASARAQHYPNIECVIVDDGSHDPGTLATLERLRQDGVGVIRQDNQGLPAARNAGVRATTAPFFVPLDADDKLAPDFVERLLPALLADSTLGYCYCDVLFFGDATGGWTCPPYDPRRLLFQNLSVSAAVVRRAAFDAVGGYRTDMRAGGEDWDFWIALLAAGYRGYRVAEPLFHYRQHSGGSMLTEMRKRHAAVMRYIIAHHRRLFASSLGVQLPDEDLSTEDGTAVDQEIYERLRALAELDYIERSRFWRLAQRLRRSAVGRLALGPQPPVAESPADMRQQLARLKASRAYRVIRAIKRTPIYRWYGRRKYGVDFGSLPIEIR